MAPKPSKNDPFPTMKLSVPYLPEMLEKLRDPKGNRLIIIFQAQSTDEGDWILANVAARLTKSGLTYYQAEPLKVIDNLEMAMRKQAAVTLLGEIRRAEDGKAMRTAAELGMRAIVAYFAMPARQDFDNSCKAIGPWTGYDFVPLSRTPPPRPAGMLY